MARNERIIHASPDAVFDVLSDPRGYAYWVIGSMEIREADDDWPQPDSRFHHTVGIGPIKVRDHTRVEEVRPGRYLQLETKARPLGNARVKLELEPAGQDTRVTMTEDPADKPTAFVFMPLTHLLMRGRNVRSLDRLAELAEGRVELPGDEAGAPSTSTEGSGSVENPEVRKRPRLGLGASLAVAATVVGVAGLVYVLRERSSL